MVCRKVKKLLPAFAHREVTAAQSKQITDHLSHCESCRLIAAQFAALAYLVSETPTPQAPSGFYQNFERELLQ